MNAGSGRQPQEAEDNRGKRKTIAGRGRRPRNPEGTACIWKGGFFGESYDR